MSGGLADISSPREEGASVISALSEELGANGDRSQASDSAQSHTAVEGMGSKLNADASDFKPRVQVVGAIALINFGSGVVAESGFGAGSCRVRAICRENFKFKFNNLFPFLHLSTIQDVVTYSITKRLYFFRSCLQVSLIWKEFSPKEL
jgi:hypothetical protein